MPFSLCFEHLNAFIYSTYIVYVEVLGPKNERSNHCKSQVVQVEV